MALQCSLLLIYRLCPVGTSTLGALEHTLDERVLLVEKYVEHVGHLAIE